MKKVIIENSSDDKFYVVLTEEQVALVKWLFNKYIICNYTIVEDENWEAIK